MPKGIYKRTKVHLSKMKKYGFQKDHIPWHKGKKTGIIPKSAFKKGHPHCKKWKEIMKNRMSGRKNPAWKGGKIISKGYVYIYRPDHPQATKDNYVKMSRLTMEKHIGRILLPTEVVHHIDRIRHHDRIENLMLFKNHSKHKQFEGSLKCKREML